MISSTNLTRAFGVFIFENRHTISFAADVIITIQNTLTESLTGLC